MFHRETLPHLSKLLLANTTPKKKTQRKSDQSYILGTPTRACTGTAGELSPQTVSDGVLPDARPISFHMDNLTTRTLNVVMPLKTGDAP